MNLEEKYRFVLRSLPKDYRERWEEDMVDTFLSTMRPDDPDDEAFVTEFGRPAWSEVSSVLSLALRLRFGGVDAPPRSYAWGQAVRRVGLVGLLMQAVMGTIGIGFTLWQLGLLPSFPDPRDSYPVPTPWAWYAVAFVVPVCSIGAFVALLWGRWRDARLLALTALVLPMLVRLLLLDLPIGYTYWLLRIFDGLFLAALLAYHHPTPPIRPRPWLIGYGVGVLAMPALLFAEPAPDEAWLLWDWPAICVAALLPALVTYLVLAALGRADRSPAWPLALSLMTGAVLVLRLLTMVDFLRYAPVHRGPSVWYALTEAVLLVAVGLPVLVHAVRQLRRLPRSSTADRVVV